MITMQQPKHFEELELIAEKAGELNDRVGRIEAELGSQTKTLDSAAMVLDAAIKGLGALKSAVLENDIASVQLQLNDKTAHLEREIGRFEFSAAEINRRAEAGDAETRAQLDAAAKDIRAKFDAHSSALTEWSSKVELTLAEQAKALAAIPPVIKGADAPSLNPRGEWASGMIAKRLDVMSYAGSSYVSNEDGNTEIPNKSKKWTVLAKRAGSIAMGGVGDFGGLAGITRPNQIAAGVNTWAVGDVLYADTTGTLKNLAPDTSGKFLQTQGAGAAPIWAAQSGTGAGDMSGPASATDDAIVRFDGISGKNVQDSNCTIDNSGNLSLNADEATLTLGSDNTASIAVSVSGSLTQSTATGQQWFTSTADTGLHLSSSSTADPGIELYTAGFLKDADGTLRKLGSDAFQWTDKNTTDGYASWNIHTTAFTAGETGNHYGLAVWAKHGARFFPTSLGASQAPGANVLAVNGAVSTSFGYAVDLAGSSATGYSHTSSRNTTNTTISTRNTSAGTAASSRISIGNNANANAVTVDHYGSNHATKPNWLEIINQSTAPLVIGSNGTPTLTLLDSNATLLGSLTTQGGTASTPATSGAAGVAGTILWDASYVYVCVATNTWKRSAIATW